MVLVQASVNHGSLFFNTSTENVMLQKIIVLDVMGTQRTIDFPTAALFKRLVTAQGDVTCGLDNLKLCTMVSTGMPPGRLSQMHCALERHGTERDVP